MANDRIRLTLNVKKILFFLIFITSSYDVFLNIRLGGFSFRFVYILILLLLLIYIYDSFKTNKLVLKHLGLNSFLIWALSLALFVPNTPLIGRNVGYLVWLFLHFSLTVIASYFSSEKNIYSLLRLYMISFICSSIIGLMQLILGLLGISFYTEQWWIQDRLPRLNGFSYEPSYYSTYLMIGFSFSYFLYRKKVLLNNLTKNTVIATFLGILLSTSRMGILVAVMQILFFELFIDKKSVKKVLFFILSFFTVLISLVIILLTNENLSFLLAGLGIMGGSAHSSIERLDGFITQIEIFSRNPLKGYSLGGVSQAIAFEKGVTNISQETIKPFDISMNIFIEVLTASGIIGFAFFMYYVYVLLIKSRRSYSSLTKNNHIIMQSLVWGLLFEFIILCFNQNILRAYLWVHIAFLNSWYFATKAKIAEY